MPAVAPSLPLVVIPTYNEQENLPLILERTIECLPAGEILVVDDSSPDGTGEIADRWAAREPRIHVLHRTGKEGLGKAYTAAFRHALAQLPHADPIVSMDADFSHDPRYLPLLVAAAATHDVAIGSRYVTGGGTQNWALHRRLLSRAGGLYARTILGIGVRDVTAGFVAYRRHVLQRILETGLQANGYGFQIEMKYRAIRAGFTSTELPIVFPDRVRGDSKMDSSIMFEAMRVVVAMRLKGNR